jgi:hypothetical protein
MSSRIEYLRQDVLDRNNGHFKHSLNQRKLKKISEKAKRLDRRDFSNVIQVPTVPIKSV